LLVLGAATDGAVVLVFEGNDNFEDLGGCGAYLVLVRGFESCEDGTGDCSVLSCDSTGAGVVPSGTRGGDGGKEGTVAALPQFPIRQYGTLDDEVLAWSRN